MKKLRDAILLLFLFFSIVLSIAQVEYFEENILNFHAAFFIILVLATLIGIWGPSRVKITPYTYMGGWAVIYILVWYFFWRTLSDPRTVQELSIQFLLMEIAAALSYNVGEHIYQIDDILKNIAHGAYPNRTLDLQIAADSINTEITRSRRYNRPLSVLVFQLNQNTDLLIRQISNIEKDLLLHFSLAKVGRIINEYARQTDLILRDHKQRFVILCPETNHQASIILGERISQAIAKKVDKEITWSTASFPEESLNFNELLEKALARLSASKEVLEK